MDKINGAVLAIRQYFAHHPANAQAVVRVVMRPKADPIKTQYQQPFAFGRVETHALVHYRIKVFGHLGAAFFGSAVRYFILWEYEVRFRPGLPVFRSDQQSLARRYALPYFIAQVFY